MPKPFLSALQRVARRVLGISQVEKKADDFLDFLGTPEGNPLSEALRSAVEFDKDVLRLRTITGWSQNQVMAVLESRPESPKRLYELITAGHLIPTDGGQLITATTYASAEALVDRLNRFASAGFTVAEIESAWWDKLLPAPPTTPCHTCQYHSTNGYLGCAVHPLGRPEGECGDWESQ
jgi:hypothetical protein